MTLLDKLKALHEIDHKLSSWHGLFIDELWAQTKQGEDDQFIDNGQAYTLRHLHERYFGDMKK